MKTFYATVILALALGIPVTWGAQGTPSAALAPAAAPVTPAAAASSDAVPAAMPADAALTPEEYALARRIYMDGVMPDGQPLKGERPGKVEVSGALAACVLCHRPSGMGTVEGDIPISPITGPALYVTDKVVATMDPRVGKVFNQRHQAYDDATLARALRKGIRVDGAQMNDMMPRYDLSDTEMRAMIGYLKQLSADWSPGVAKHQIRFATVITPDVPADRRALFKDMVNRIVRMKNGSTMVASPYAGRTRRHMAAAAEFVLGTERTWAIDFWEVSGPPDTWEKQLEERYQAQPVFALVSGLSNSTWQPIQAFCEKNHIPSWFPSVDFVPEQESFYALYFTRGVGLEAGVLARHLTEQQRPRRVVQIYRDDPVGRAAAAELARTLKDSGIAVDDRPLKGESAAELAVLLKGLGKNDAVMFWLRQNDVALLDKVAPPAAATYFSAQMSRGEMAPFPAAWKERLKLVYPFEIPDRRMANMAYFHGFLRQQRVPLVDEPLQDEVYFALSYLTDTVTEMLDNLYRDYLIERAENMLVRRELAKAEEEVRTSTMVRFQPTYSQAAQRPAGVSSAAHNVVSDPTPTELGLTTRMPPPANLTGKQAANLPALQRAGQVVGKREGTTVYPRLSIGPGQRFASKGGYIASFTREDALVADSDWIVP